MAKHRDWENPPNVGRNKLPGYMPLGAYPDAALALACCIPIRLIKSMTNSPSPCRCTLAGQEFDIVDPSGNALDEYRRVAGQLRDLLTYGLTRRPALPQSGDLS